MRRRGPPGVHVARSASHVQATLAWCYAAASKAFSILVQLALYLAAALTAIDKLLRERQKAEAGQAGAEPGSSSSSSQQQGSSSGWGPKWNSSSKNRAPPPEEDEYDEYDDFGNTSYSKKYQVPKGATGEVARVLAAKDLYEVLEVAKDASPEEIKKLQKKKWLQTHPDKVECKEGANEAFQRVVDAGETLLDAEKRRRYDVSLDPEKRRKRAQPGANVFDDDFEPKFGISPELDEILTRVFAGELPMEELFNYHIRQTMEPPPPGADYPLANTEAYEAKPGKPSFRLRCLCGYDHIATREGPLRGDLRPCPCYSCTRRGGFLPVHDGDMWVQYGSRMLVYTIKPDKAYRCVGNTIYDVTDYAMCNGWFDEYVPESAHRTWKLQPDRRGAGGGMGGGTFKGRNSKGQSSGPGQHKAGPKKGKKGKR